MANRKGYCAGSASGARSVSKVGKIRVERLSRLATEEKDRGKSVTFKLRDRKEESDEQEAGREGLSDMKALIKQIVRKDIKDNLKEQEDKIKKEIEELKVRVKKEEERMKDLRKEERG